MVGEKRGKKKLDGLKKKNPKVGNKGPRFREKYKEKLDFTSKVLNFQHAPV